MQTQFLSDAPFILSFPSLCFLDNLIYDFMSITSLIKYINMCSFWFQKRKRKADLRWFLWDDTSEAGIQGNRRLLQL